MIVSLSVESFWESYFKLSPTAKRHAKKAYRLWVENPYHPSLRFKCINATQNICSARISLGYRALCIFRKQYCNMVLDW